MAAVAEMLQPAGLDAEWRRIEILAQCLLESRGEAQPAESLLQQLRDSQRQVERLRQESSLWQALALEQLPDLALDILAAVYAPAVNPGAALLFQDLQQSSGAYPTLAFLHRLLAFN